MNPELQRLFNAIEAECPGWRVDSAAVTASFDLHQKIFQDANIGDTRRFDAGESALLARQLLFVKAKEVFQLFTKTKARQFIPTSNEIPSGAETFSTKIWTQVGQADFITNYGADLPSSDAYASEVILPIRSVGNSYRYSVQDLRRSAFAGNVALDSRRAAAARLVHEKKIESIACLGDTKQGLGGFAKNANVSVITGGTTTGFTGLWQTQTDARVILADLNFIAQQVIVNSKEVHTPDTMLLDTKSFALLSQKPANSYSEKPILRAFLENNPYIKNVDQWQMLDAANASNNGARVICYQRDPSIVSLEIPQEFEQFAPQQQNLEFVINCHSRIAGTVVYYPLAFVYADNV